MKEYLKMADVLPNGVVISPLHSEIQQQYADHAINSHDELVAEVERLRSTLQQCVGALYIAHKFCGNHTADECGDEIAIPISDALVAASKIVAPSNLGVTND